MIPELEKALNTCNVDKLAAILAHNPSLINALNDKGVPYAFADLFNISFKSVILT